MILRYTRPVALSKLHDELLAAGLAPSHVEGASDGSSAQLTFADDVDQAAIDKVVAAHDPTPVPPPADPVLAIAAASTLDELKLALLAQIDPDLARTLKGA